MVSEWELKFITVDNRAKGMANFPPITDTEWYEETIFQKGAASTFKTPRKYAYSVEVQTEDDLISNMAKVIKEMAEVMRASMANILHLSTLVGELAKGVSVSNLFTEFETIDNMYNML